LCGVVCQHDFVYSHPYHPDNSTKLSIDATCKICGKVEKQDYGHSDYY
jgi:predicted transcriptional regulator